MKNQKINNIYSKILLKALKYSFLLLFVVLSNNCLAQFNSNLFINFDYKINSFKINFDNQKILKEGFNTVTIYGRVITFNNSYIEEKPIYIRKIDSLGKITEEYFYNGSRGFTTINYYYNNNSTFYAVKTMIEKIYKSIDTITAINKYDKNSNITSNFSKNIYTPDTIKTFYFYNKSNQIEKIVYENKHTNSYITTYYFYDENGNLKYDITDGHKYEYQQPTIKIEIDKFKNVIIENQNTATIIVYNAVNNLVESVYEPFDNGGIIYLITYSYEK